MTDKNEKNRVECIFPVLGVGDLAKSVHFYTETQGFKVDWAAGGVGSVSRDGHAIMLSENAGKGAWAWVGLEDDSLFDAYVECGVTVIQEPRNYSWPFEMKIEDPDGNILWLGTEPKADLPFLDEVPS